MGIIGGSRSSLIEQAKEELEILEFQHPNNFFSLKQELKAFISELESQNLVEKSSTMFASPSAATQESTSRKRKKKGCCVAEEVDIEKVGSIKRRCKTDAVLERAQECLHKIQNFKTSLCS